MTKAPAVEFECAVSKVQTLADGGLRVTLDLPEGATVAAKSLMDWRGKYLKATLVATPNGDAPKVWGVKA